MVAAINNAREVRAAQAQAAALGAAAAVEPVRAVEAPVPSLPNDALQDFWKTLWHVDVYKDHGNDYNADIINKFLPNDKYTTTLICNNGKYITENGATANRTVNKIVVNFSDLFEYLTGLNFTKLCTLRSGSPEIDIILKEDLLGPGINYQIKIFDSDGTGMKGFVQDNVAMYIDTASHIPEMMSKFNGEPGDNKLSYAYTREIESDPADKMTYQTIGKENQSRFYYEMVAPNNPTILPYAPFTPDDGLSYFYCKWPLFLRYNGSSDKPNTRPDKRKYKLDVELSYSKDGKMIVITEGMNIAGAAKNALLKLVGIPQSDLLKEMVFISKHHGDVAQSLVKFRNVKMENPQPYVAVGAAGGNIINSNEYKGAFVSIDVNAIIKALTIQMPYIFMYPPDKKSIIVWKNVTNITPDDLYKYQLQYTRDMFKKYKENIEKYNDKIDKLNINLEIYNRNLRATFDCADPGGAAAVRSLDRYIKLIREGFSLAILSKYVPKGRLNNYNDKIEENDYIKMLNNNLENEDQLIDIDEIKKFQNKLDNVSSFEIPKDYGNLDMFDEEGNAKVAVEKEVALSFKREGTKYIFKKSRNVKNVWDYIDFKFIVGQGRGDIPDSIECRSGTKLNSSWGIDIIQYIYTELENYEKGNGNKFIDCLRKIVNQLKDDEKNTFNFGLSLVGINLTNIIISGGARPTGLSRFQSRAWLAQTQKAHRNTLKPALRTQKNKINNKTKKQTTDRSDIIMAKRTSLTYKEYYLKELSEIKNHLELMKDLTFLYNNYITDLKNDVAFNEEKGLDILNKYAEKQFSIYAPVNNVMIENKDENKDKNMDKTILELNPKDNYYVSYSVIKYYNYIKNQYEHFRDGFKIYYTLKTGSPPPDFTINTDDIERELNLIEQLIIDLDINPWDKSREVKAAWVGGKHKIQKKHKTQKKRTKK